VVKIPSYSIYHCDHPDGTAHGGAAIIIRTTLQHYEVPAYQTDKIQAAIIQIKAQLWSFNKAAMYSPPRHRTEVDDYDNFLHHLGNKIHCGLRLERKTYQLGISHNHSKRKKFITIHNKLQLLVPVNGRTYLLAI